VLRGFPFLSTLMLVSLHPVGGRGQAWDECMYMYSEYDMGVASTNLLIVFVFL